MLKEDISKKLKFKRKELNLSVFDICEKLKEYGINIASKTLYGWESGNRQPDADSFIALCDIYGIDDIVDFFYSDKDTSEETWLINIFRELNETGQEYLLEQAKFAFAQEKYQKQPETKNIRLNNQTDDKMVNIPLVARGEVKGVQQIQVNEKEFDEEFKKLIPSDLDL